MAIALDSSGSLNVFAGGGGVGRIETFTHTCAGSDRFLIVLQTWGNSSGDPRILAGDEATFDGNTMTLLTSIKHPTGGSFQFGIYVWYLVNPPTTTDGVVTLTWNSAWEDPNTFVAGHASSWTGVDQTTPLSGTPATQELEWADTITSLSITTADANAELFSMMLTGADGTYTAEDSQTVLLNTAFDDTGTNEYGAFGHKTAGAAGAYNLDWSDPGIGSGVIWALKPAAGAAATPKGGLGGIALNGPFGGPVG